MKVRFALIMTLVIGVLAGLYGRDLAAEFGAARGNAQAAALPKPECPPQVDVESSGGIGGEQLFPDDAPAVAWSSSDRAELARRLDALLLGRGINVISIASPKGEHIVLTFLFEAISRAEAYALIEQLDTKFLRETAGFQKIRVIARDSRTEFIWNLEEAEGRLLLNGPTVDTKDARLR